MIAIFTLLSLAVVALGETATPSVPTLDVRSCEDRSSPRATASFATSVPDREPFPLTEVDVCYTTSHIRLGFSAYNETSFFYNASQTTNDEIWRYEVMEAFISRGSGDPSTYLEFEISPSPDNVTYQSFIFNPSKTREEGAPFDHFFVSDPDADGFDMVGTATSVELKQWYSTVMIPLALWNVDAGMAKGTEWRMNFFRTVTDETLYPDQLLGGWSVPDRASFHMTPFFGHVLFV